MKGKILIVDDEADFRALLKEFLEASDFSVTEADSGAALNKCFSEEAPNVMLLDLNLKQPGANGLDLLPQIKKNWPDTEVIVLTGESSYDAAVQATKLGAFHFINKPDFSQVLPVTLGARLKTSSSAKRAIPCAAPSPP